MPTTSRRPSASVRRVGHDAAGLEMRKPPLSHDAMARIDREMAGCALEIESLRRAPIECLRHGKGIEPESVEAIEN